MTELQVWMGVGLILTLVLVLGFGYVGYKKTRTQADYSIAGATLGPYVLGLAYAATFFSTATFIGYTGWVYGWGLSSLWIILTLIFASPMGMLVMAKRVRATNTHQKSLSLPDWLGDRYGSDALRIIVAVATLFNLFYIGAQFSAGALVFEQFLDVPYTAGLLAIAVFVVLYTVAGASYVDIYTDAVQAVLMAVMGILVFVSALWVFDGGLTNAMEQSSAALAAQGPEYVAVVNPDSGIFYSVPAIIGAFIIQFAFAAQPQLFNKVLALKNPWDMSKMVLTYVLCAAAFLAAVFGGLYAAAAVPGLEDPDTSILAYAQVAFPVVVVAFLGVAILSAALSTSDGIFIVISTAVANDIYRKSLVGRGVIKTPPDQADIRALRISRVVTVITGVAATLLVVDQPEFIGSFIWIGISGVASATLGPILVGLFLPRLANAKAAVVSALVGMGSYGVIFFAGFEESEMAAGAWAVLIGVAAMLLAGLYFRDEPTGAPGEGRQEADDRDTEKGME